MSLATRKRHMKRHIEKLISWGHLTEMYQKRRDTMIAAYHRIPEDETPFERPKPREKSTVPMGYDNEGLRAHYLKAADECRKSKRPRHQERAKHFDNKAKELEI